MRSTQRETLPAETVAGPTMLETTARAWFTCPMRALRRGLEVVVVAALAASVASPARAAAPTAGDVTTGAATAATQRAFAGTGSTVDSTPRHGVQGKHVVVISAGQASLTAKVGVDAAVDAARKIGWQVDVYDGKLDPSTYGSLVRQAIAAHADGIILGAIDCQTVAGPLREARKAGIKVVGAGSFDCDDPHGGGRKQGLFSANINFAPLAKSTADFARGYGADAAHYVISASNNKARILAVNDPEFTTLYYTDNGFRKTVARSRGTRIVSTLNATTADFTSGRLVAMIQAELVKHPDITWIKSPFTYATTLGVVPALAANPNHVKVMGGEGLEPELDLVRDGKITAVNVFPSEWFGWAAVDTLNSVFRGEKPVPSGIGWMLADANHNLPASGPAKSSVDFRAQYEKAWGANR
jgi:ribose transport system substrate-binding protein